MQWVRMGSIVQWGALELVPAVLKQSERSIAFLVAVSSNCYAILEYTSVNKKNHARSNH